MAPCKHANLFLDVSPNAAEAGFARPPATKRRAATYPVPSRVQSDTAEKEAHRLAGTFPGPLVLPDDLLSVYPKDPDSGQTVGLWSRSKHRNRLNTNTPNTIHVAAPPSYSSKMKHVKNWIIPLTATEGEQDVTPPKPKDLADYLAAYYHPLPVRQTPHLSWVPWEQKPGSAKDDRYIGLQQDQNVTRIRTRPCPDGAYERQLNLSDILDALLHMVETIRPRYALVMMLHHDLYEDEEDDFCCGRAYGGSRVSVVTSSRYHPGLDHHQGIERAHMWPASHCVNFVNRMCGIRPSKSKKRKAVGPDDGVSGDGKGTAIRAAVDASTAAPPPEKDLAGLWFGRTALTISHELGHCFCLGHCNYYACAMQGTAGIVEDVRQPPYLCPVCLEKVMSGFLEVPEYARIGRDALVLQRYEKLYEFCTDKKRAGVKMFAGYGAWLEKRIDALKASEEKKEEKNSASCIDLTNDSE
ncbi:hypothetical protein QBC40DRAFT_43692 [Triangularia verruculosa]|uniref:Archaemetzincin-2 n=1 Tax=Triangularia verruculosa TaxID=2587418 RepID=A0AAN6XKL6_9PEZI|nr:hypothetical protein QBC40DRAFT_43692 [Triangularia verruculosa]